MTKPMNFPGKKNIRREKAIERMKVSPSSYTDANIRFTGKRTMTKKSRVTKKEKK